MAVQNLNEVQRAFVNETVRPTIDAIIRAYYTMDVFIADYDNQQTPIATTGDQLGDGNGGTAPRTDAPVLTGTNLAQLRTLVGNMKTQLDGPTLNALLRLLVRSLSEVLGRREI